MWATQITKFILFVQWCHDAYDDIMDCTGPLPVIQNNAVSVGILDCWDPS